MYKFIGKATVSLIGMGTLFASGFILGILSFGLSYAENKEKVTEILDEVASTYETIKLANEMKDTKDIKINSNNDETPHPKAKQEQDTKDPKPESTYDEDVAETSYCSDTLESSILKKF